MSVSYNRRKKNRKKKRKLVHFAMRGLQDEVRDADKTSEEMVEEKQMESSESQN